MIKKVAFTMYSVKDMSRAKNFYENTLGLKLSSTAGDGKWVEYDLPGGGCFAITTFVPEILPSSKEGGTIAFEVDNLETTMKELKAAGVQVKTDTFSTPVCKMSVVLDSEGNSLMLHQLNAK
jgi:predicted enzyme related to lactoylglutathione lyase